MFSVLKSRSARARLQFVALALAGMAAAWSAPAAVAAAPGATPVYTMSPVGWVRKSGGRTFIEIERRYQPALMGVEELKSIQVLYWFDRNDSPEKRAVLQVHPRGDPERPLRGVFATRSPLRPNLIALSEATVLAVRDNVVEIDGIDAFADTPVLDLKP
ncbi:MAG: SAM-dependent methyltransferase [Sulfuritalea sp.]|nr:SAM-dependent methyltransferase [Sulfuritalea sp.]